MVGLETLSAGILVLFVTLITIEFILTLKNLSEHIQLIDHTFFGRPKGKRDRIIEVIYSLINALSKLKVPVFAIIVAFIVVKIFPTTPGGTLSFTIWSLSFTGPQGYVVLWCVTYLVIIIGVRLSLIGKR